MKEIKAKEGYYLSDKNKTVFFKSVKGANVNADNYIEVTEEEAKGIIKHAEAVRDIDSLEKIDDYSYKASVIPECINAIPMSNNEALERKLLFPLWQEGIQVKKGEKYQHLEKLYEVVQAHTTQANWSPENQSSLWVEVVEDHAGTLEDPIPYNEELNPLWQGMILEEGKYYTQSKIIYKCTRNSGIKLTQNLSALVGTYVEQIK